MTKDFIISVIKKYGTKTSNGDILEEHYAFNLKYNRGTAALRYYEKEDQLWIRGSVYDLAIKYPWFNEFKGHLLKFLCSKTTLYRELYNE